MIRYVLPGAEPKTDWDIGKREIERDHLSYFLNLHRRATGEKIEIVAESETPDFIGRDADGNSVGIELTQLRFSWPSGTCGASSRPSPTTSTPCSR